ncbi:hypothetical protein [Enterococcus mundtii]|uniref:hypothetical protein n=1 Tax=Enterococcus mundtii TaxID=53346 RepID=UPI001FB95A71|nr:hypothetical protein [Enterococcus mundtii]GKS56413.1 hypothetical protein EMLAB_30280 [Enterococcus mundtii]
MKIDSTITFALIIAFVSLLSPIAVALMNNRHLRKMKEMEHTQENFRNITLHKRDILENFLRLVGEFSSSDTGVKMSELTVAYYMLLPYIPESKAIYFRDFSDIIAKGNFSGEDGSIKNLLHDQIIPTIKMEIEKLQTK